MKRIIGGALVALTLTACGLNDLDIDMAAIEEEIEAGIVDQADLDVTVDCPSSIDWKAGEDFRCFAEADDGSRLRVTVYMENDEGEYAWQVE
jgi:hypothetical protein